MTILKIEIGENNPILRQKAKEIKEINAEIKQLVLDMIETLKVNQGLGLAAPQIGQLLKIIVVKPESDQEALVLINPEIKKTSRKKEIMQEGCLSLPASRQGGPASSVSPAGGPSISVPVERAVKIKVEGLNIDGRPIKIKAKGLLARVIQHEIEHLDGILIVDKKYDQS